METIRQKQVGELIRRHFSMVLMRRDYLWPRTARYPLERDDDARPAHRKMLYFRLANRRQTDRDTRAGERNRRLRQSLLGKIGRQMRRMPEIQFFLDDTIDEMYRVDELLNKIDSKGSDPDFFHENRPFFGFFNPIHIGHMIIAEFMATQTDLDKVWLVVSPQNPLKPKKTLARDHDRLHWVKNAIAENPNLRASDIEFSMPKPSFTVDTLAFLKEKHPEHEFALIMGGDSLASLHLWKNYRTILEATKSMSTNAQKSTSASWPCTRRSIYSTRR